VRCGAGERWRSSAGKIVREMRKYDMSQRGEEYPTHNKNKKRGVIGLVTSCAVISL
jgi:hypothetical protein